MTEKSPGRSFSRRVTRFVAGSIRASVPEPSFATQTAPYAAVAPPGEAPVGIRATTCGEEPSVARATPSSASFASLRLHRCGSGRFR